VIGVVEVDGDAEQGSDSGPVVGFVIGQRLAGPVAGDEHPPAAEAEGASLVDFGLAVDWFQAGLGVLGLHSASETSSMDHSFLVAGPSGPRFLVILGLLLTGVFSPST
jgi:hypothetical protein